MPSDVPHNCRRRNKSPHPGPATPVPSRSSGTFTSNHGTSHNRLPRPTTTNIARHPYRSTASPPNSVLNPGPAFDPASTKAFANPLRPSGKYRTKIFDEAGYATLSPTPNSSLAPSNAPKLSTIPTAAVASDQIKNAPA